jgi:hypothetical protein
VTSALIGGATLLCSLLLPVQPAASGDGPGRWIEIQTGTLSARYRMVENSAGERTASHLQYNGMLRGRFKFDRGAKLTLNAAYGTGNNFSGSWNNLGPGTGDFAGKWFLKQLYAAWTPVTGVELSYGGIGLVRGAATEVTTYDNDGYLTGERVTIKRPADLFFTEITATSAYFGDLSTPGIFDRGDRFFGDRNYFQLMASKTARGVTMSADYTRLSSEPWLRLAVNAATPTLRVIDSIRIEHYTRFADDEDASGFAASVEKAVTSRLTAGIGYADIDPRHPGFNGDRYVRGKRLFETASFRISQDLTAQLFLTQAVNNGFAIPNDQRIDVILAANVLGAIKRLTR